MNDNRVTKEHIDKLIEESSIEVEHRKYGNMTLVNLTTPWGFHITETSACIDPENYSEEIGEAICMSRIEQRLWQLEGYFKMQYDYMIEQVKTNIMQTFHEGNSETIVVTDEDVAKCVSRNLNQVLAYAN